METDRFAVEDFAQSIWHALHCMAHILGGIANGVHQGVHLHKHKHALSKC